MPLLLHDAVEKFRDKPPKSVVTVEGSTPAPAPPTEKPAPPPIQKSAYGKATLSDIHNLSAFTDEDAAMRYPLDHVLIDPVRKQIVASDARKLAIVPIEDVEGDGPFLVSGETLKHLFGIRKTIGHKMRREVRVEADEVVKVSMTTQHGELTLEHPQWQGDEKQKLYPRFDDLIPKGKHEFDIAFDAVLLKQICQHAINSCKELDISTARMWFRFTSNQNAALITLHSDSTKYSNPFATYVLMSLSPFESVPATDT